MSPAAPLLGSGRCLALSYDVTHLDGTRLNNSGAYTPEVKLPPERRVYELHRLRAEALHELPAPGMRLLCDLDHRRAQLQPSSWREIRGAQVQINEELVSRE